MTSPHKSLPRDVKKRELFNAWPFFYVVTEIRSGFNKGSDRPPVAVKKVTPPSNTTTTSNHLNNNLAIRKTSGGSGVIGKVGSGLTAAKQPKSSSPGVTKKNAINSTGAYARTFTNLAIRFFMGMLRLFIFLGPRLDFVLAYPSMEHG